MFIVVTHEQIMDELGLIDLCYRLAFICVISIIFRQFM